MSFLENENQMVIDAIYSDIGEQLVEDWINSNLDEGQMYADFRFAEMSNDNYIKGRFNRHYNLTPDDQMIPQANAFSTLAPSRSKSRSFRLRSVFNAVQTLSPMSQKYRL